MSSVTQTTPGATELATVSMMGGVALTIFPKHADLDNEDLSLGGTVKVLGTSNVPSKLQTQ